MVNIRAVHLDKDAFTKLEDLIKKSLNLSQLVNRLASTDYRDLAPDHSEWDFQHGTSSFPDPLRNALKIQKFYALAAGGLLHSAAHAASNSLIGQGSFHPYTPMVTGVIARPCVEFCAASYFILKQRDNWEKTSAAYRLMKKGLKDYHWDKPGLFRETAFYTQIEAWGIEKGVKAKPVFNSDSESDLLVDLPMKPHRFLSDFVHGNATVVSLSVIDAQENLGTNLQNDYWCLAASYSAILSLSEEYFDQLSTEKKSEFQKEIRVLGRFEETIRATLESNWGKPKAIPDRDLMKRL